MTGNPITTKEVYEAYLDCRKRKRTKDSTTAFEQNLSRNLYKITKQLRSETWSPSSSMCFAVLQPKPREIWAAEFSDRIVHHIVYNRLRPRIEPKFISTSFACIEKRGTLIASKWAHKSMAKITHNWSRDAWYLQMDIANFFPSIDQDILWSLIEPYCYEPWLKSAMFKIVKHDVTNKVHFPNNGKNLDKIEHNKSLWYAKKGKGLPIGNLTSQFAANIYLNKLDWYIKSELKPKHYGRYVDDLLFFDENKKKLIVIRDKVNKFASEVLLLNMHPKKTRIQRIKSGVDFVGWRLLPYRKYLRRTTVSRANNKIINSWHNTDTIFKSLNSYLGQAIHGNTFNLRSKWSKIASNNSNIVATPNKRKVIKKCPIIQTQNK